MSDPATNLGTLQEFVKSQAWILIRSVLDDQMDRALVPPAISGSVDEIAVASVSRSATYQTLLWVRERMLPEMIEREREALSE